MARKRGEFNVGCQLQWRDRVDSTASALRHLLWPPQCLLCGGSGRAPAMDLCHACEGDLVPLGPACMRCAQPLPAVATALVCGHCLRRPPAFDRSFCAFRYAAPLDELVRAFKYGGNTASGRALAQLFCTRLRDREAPLPECFIPVPLSTRRYRERGFNQAIELGTQIERGLGIRMRADVVVRTRDTAEQAGLKPRQRRRNVRGAFAAVRALPAARIAVLDDVMTTGSTANELARVLRTAGAREIEMWAIARAGKDSGHWSTSS